MSIYSQIVGKVNKLTVAQLVLFAYLINLSVSVLFGYVLFPEQEDNPNHLPDDVYFFASILIAPFAETWLVQYFLMEYGYKWFNRYWPGMVLSAIIFSIMHHYSVPYMLKTLITGSVYTSVYFVCMVRKWNGFLWTSVVHLLHNLTALFFNYFIDG